MAILLKFELGRQTGYIRNMYVQYIAQSILTIFGRNDSQIVNVLDIVSALLVCV